MSRSAFAQTLRRAWTGETSREVTRWFTERSSPEASEVRGPPPPLRGYGATAFAREMTFWLAEPKLAEGERRLVSLMFVSWNRIGDWLRRLEAFRQAS